jgi:predicted glycosyl hydrolase (DUF1957 family)
MGILDKVNNDESSSESVEEVTISPAEEQVKTETEDRDDGSRLRKQAEQELTDGGSDISLEDVHRQNERIIELLEQVTGEDASQEEPDNDAVGGLDGVL